MPDMVRDMAAATVPLAYQPQPQEPQPDEAAVKAYMDLKQSGLSDKRIAQHNIDVARLRRETYLFFKNQGVSDGEMKKRGIDVSEFSVSDAEMPAQQPIPVQDDTLPTQTEKQPQVGEELPSPSEETLGTADSWRKNAQAWSDPQTAMANIYKNAAELSTEAWRDREKENPIERAFWDGVSNSTISTALLPGQTVVNPELNGLSEKLAFSLGHILPEIPIMMAGGLLGKGLALGETLTASKARKIYSIMSASGGGFAMMEGLNKLFHDKIEKGEVDSVGDFVDRTAAAIKATAQGELTGQIVGWFSGPGGKAVLSPLVKTGVISSKIAKPLSKAVGFTGEVGSMTTVPAALQGRLPSEEDFAVGFLLVSGLKGASKGASAISRLSQLPDAVQKEYKKYRAKRVDDVVAEMPEHAEAINKHYDKMFDENMRARFREIPEGESIPGYRARGEKAEKVKPEKVAEEGAAGAEKIPPPDSEAILKEVKEGQARKADRRAIENREKNLAEPKPSVARKVFGLEDKPQAEPKKTAAKKPVKKKNTFQARQKKSEPKPEKKKKEFSLEDREKYEAGRELVEYDYESQKWVKGEVARQAKIKHRKETIEALEGENAEDYIASQPSPQNKYTVEQALKNEKAELADLESMGVLKDNNVPSGWKSKLGSRFQQRQKPKAKPKKKAAPKGRKLSSRAEEKAEAMRRDEADRKKNAPSPETRAKEVEVGIVRTQPRDPKTRLETSADHGFEYKLSSPPLTEKYDPVIITGKIRLANRDIDLGSLKVEKGEPTGTQVSEALELLKANGVERVVIENLRPENIQLAESLGQIKRVGKEHRITLRRPPGWKRGNETAIKAAKEYRKNYMKWQPKEEKTPEIYDTDDIGAAIRKMGGINYDSLAKTYGKSFAKNLYDIPSAKGSIIRKKGGKSLEITEEALGQTGHLKKDQHGKIEPHDIEEKLLAWSRNEDTSVVGEGWSEKEIQKMEVENAKGYVLGEIERAYEKYSEKYGDKFYEEYGISKTVDKDVKADIRKMKTEKIRDDLEDCRQLFKQGEKPLIDRYSEMLQVEINRRSKKVFDQPPKQENGPVLSMFGGGQFDKIWDFVRATGVGTRETLLNKGPKLNRRDPVARDILSALKAEGGLPRKIAQAVREQRGSFTMAEIDLGETAMKAVTALKKTPKKELKIVQKEAANYLEGEMDKVSAEVFRKKNPEYAEWLDKARYEIDWAQNTLADYIEKNISNTNAKDQVKVVQGILDGIIDTRTIDWWESSGKKLIEAKDIVQIMRDSTGKYLRRKYMADLDRGGRLSEGYVPEADLWKMAIEEILRDKNFPDVTTPVLAKAKLEQILTDKKAGIPFMSVSEVRGAEGMFKRRAPVPKYLREFLGEVRDPVVRYYTTMLDLTKNITRMEMFDTMSKNKLMFSEKMTPEMPSKVSEYMGEQLNKEPYAYGAIKDLYTTREMADFLSHQAKMMDAFDTMFMRAMGFMKGVKTVWNPPTHMRNMLGNVEFSILDGTSIFNPKNFPYYRQAISLLCTRARGKLSDSQRKLYENLVRHGAIHTEFSEVEVVSSMNRLHDLGVDYKGLIPDWIKLPYRAGEKIASGFYSAEDQIFKIASVLKKMDKEKLDMSRATEKMYNNFPNYAEVTRAVERFKKSPFIIFKPFISFDAEAYRIFGTAVKNGGMRRAKALALMNWRASHNLVYSMASRGLGLWAAMKFMQENELWYSNLACPTNFTWVSNMMGVEKTDSKLSQQSVAPFDLNIINPKKFILDQKRGNILWSIPVAILSSKGRFNEDTSFGTKKGLKRKAINTGYAVNSFTGGLVKATQKDTVGEGVKTFMKRSLSPARVKELKESEAKEPEGPAAEFRRRQRKTRSGGSAFQKIRERQEKKRERLPR